MNTANQFTTYDTIIVFLIIVASVDILFTITLLISSYPSKRLVKSMYKHSKLDLEEYYFYFQKATAYRLLYNTNLTFYKLIKILSASSTFVTVYCAIDNNDFILLFSLIAAMSEIGLLTTPGDTYSKMYVRAARKLEYVLNNGDNLQEPELSKVLSEAYQEAEKIIEEGFE